MKPKPSEIIFVRMLEAWISMKVIIYKNSLVLHMNILIYLQKISIRIQSVWRVSTRINNTWSFGLFSYDLVEGPFRGWYWDLFPAGFTGWITLLLRYTDDVLERKNKDTNLIICIQMIRVHIFTEGYKTRQKKIILLYNDYIQSKFIRIKNHIHANQNCFIKAN